MYADTERHSSEQVQVLADRLHREHRHFLLRIAAKNAANRDDAEEAVQLAFLAFLEHFDPDGEAPPLPWLVLVAKRDCWARCERRRRDRSVARIAAGRGGGAAALIDSIPSRAAGPEQLVVRVDEARGKLAALKPQELRALTLLATGYSYHEVCAITGWTYTKVNRCIAEGRARLRANAATEQPSGETGQRRG